MCQTLPFPFPLFSNLGHRASEDRKQSSMAPKRSGRARGEVVVEATQKVVEETVKVTVLGSRKQKPVREEVKTSEKIEDTSRAGEEPVKKIFEEEEGPEESQREQGKDDEEPTEKDTLEEQPRKEQEKKKRTKTQEARVGKEKKRGTRRRRRKEGDEEYKRYVFRVLKHVHPEQRISSKAMTVLNGFMNDMFERIAAEAAKLSMYTGKTTLSARGIQGAVKLVLPGELGKHAMTEGTKAVSTYMSYPATGGGRKD